MTKSLQEALCRLALKMGGQASADTGQEEGFSGSRDTILRLVHQWKQPAKSEPHVIGLNNWFCRRANEALKAHQTKYVCSSRSQSSQALRASPSPKSLERKNKKKQAQQDASLKILRERKKNRDSQHTTNVISEVA